MFCVTCLTVVEKLRALPAILRESKVINEAVQNFTLTTSCDKSKLRSPA